jgi:phosphoesterase RecJ-like protein
MSGYVTNISLADIASVIHKELAAGGSIAIMTHAKPDGDAAGSSLGLCRAINQLKPGSAAVWHGGAMPAWVKPLFEGTQLNVIEKDGLPASSTGLALVLDTGSWSQLDHVAPFLKGRADRTIVVDHHRSGDPDVATRRHVNPLAGSVCQIVAELARLVLNLDSISKLDRAIAQPLYLGNATDTGWFRHSNVTGDLLRVAASLVEAGAEPSTLYQLTEQQDRPQRLKLLACALQSLELCADSQLGIMTLTRADFSATGAEPSESGGFVDFPALVPTVRVVALLTETTDQLGAHQVKISFRSKSGPRAVDVNKVAQKFGGGGHFAAAGGRTTLSLAEAKAAVIKELTATLTGT